MKELQTITIEDVHCPVASAFKCIEGKWKLPILWILTLNGTLRFLELKKCVVGITSMMLTSSLKELEKDGLIDRIQYDEIPPRVDYSLSEHGRKLYPIFGEFAKWGMEFKKSREG